MKEEYVSFSLGRQKGRTDFPKSEEPKFTYNDDFRLVPYGDSAIAAYRRITEQGNESDSIIRVIGLVNPTLRALAESGVKIPKSEISKLKDGSDKEDVQRILREKFGKTSEPVIFE